MGKTLFSAKLPLPLFHGHMCGKKPIRLKLENGEADNFAMCFKLIKIAQSSSIHNEYVKNEIYLYMEKDPW